MMGNTAEIIYRINHSCSAVIDTLIDYDESVNLILKLVIPIFKNWFIKKTYFQLQFEAHKNDINSKTQDDVSILPFCVSNWLSWMSEWFLCHI